MIKYSKFYYIIPDMSNYLENIFVLGNGPSFIKIDYDLLPQNFKVMRCNTFYLEDKYYAGKQVDYYLFYALCIDEMYFNLRAIHAKKESQEMFKWSLDRHPMQVQTDFITLLQREFANQNFYSVSPESPLNKIVSIASKNNTVPSHLLPQEKGVDRTLNLLVPPELCKNKNRNFK
jgi:hypothetical protein